MHCREGKPILDPGIGTTSRENHPVNQPDRITWDDSYRLGIPEIDKEHHHLVAMINDLSRGIDSGQGDAVLGAILARLRQYVQRHFRNEEKLMLEMGYSELEQHKKLHTELTEAVVTYCRRFESGERLRPSDLLNFLSDWLVNHIQKEDMKLVHEDAES